MRHVYMCPMSGCWLWTAAGYGNGYGAFSDADYKTVTAHRASWTLHCGPIPAGKFVCHRCDVRSCVNPAHLFLGTSRENYLDMVRKGRRVSRCVRGEAQHLAKLTANDIPEIKSLYANGATQAEIGKRYGVGQNNISWILRGKGWAHV